MQVMLRAIGAASGIGEPRQLCSLRANPVGKGVNSFLLPQLLIK